MRLFRPKLTCYTIACTMRSGSNLLSAYLIENGLGQPSEYFQYPLGVNNRRWYEVLRVPTDDFPKFLQTLIRVRSKNSIFGTKLMWDHKNVLVEEAKKYMPSATDVQDIFPNHKFIYLFRKDKIGQAISLWRAVQTGSWSSLDQAKQAEPEYDFFRLLSHFYYILADDYLWDHYFDTHDVPVMRIAYEDFTARPQETIREIHRYLRPKMAFLRMGKVKVPHRLQKQRDQFSATIRQRFLEDLYHMGERDYWMPRRLQLDAWNLFFQQAQWKQS